MKTSLSDLVKRLKVEVVVNIVQNAYRKAGPFLPSSSCEIRIEAFLSKLVYHIKVEVVRHIVRNNYSLFDLELRFLPQSDKFGKVLFFHISNPSTMA